MDSYFIGCLYQRFKKDSWNRINFVEKYNSLIYFLTSNISAV